MRELELDPLSTPHDAHFEAREHNSVLTLVDGVPTFRHIAKLLSECRRRLWIAVSFVDVRNWRMPSATDDGDERDLWQVLRGAARNGAAVRVLFWTTNSKSGQFRNVFRANNENRVLAESKLRGSGVHVRWASSGDDHRHCHHEKTWIIDESSLTGGIVLTSGFLSVPSHELGRMHDLYLEVRGPAARDVAVSFTQRWDASADSLFHLDDKVAIQSLLGDEEDWRSTPSPSGVAPHDSDCRVQVTRTLRAGYVNERPAGETSSWAMLRNAIRSARRFVYIENQHIAHGPLLDELFAAVDRGVRVIYVVPSKFIDELAHWTVASLFRTPAARKPLIGAIRGVASLVNWAVPHRYARVPTHDRPREFGRTFVEAQAEYQRVFRQDVPRIGKFGDEKMLLAGIAVQSDTRLRGLYVHSKLVMVDDEFFMCGSANNVDLSLEADHTELNCAVWSSAATRTLRENLFAEHIGPRFDAGASSETQLDQFVHHACENATRVNERRRLDGHVYRIDPCEYGAQLELIAHLLARR